MESSTLWFVQVDREVGLYGVGVLAAQRWLGVGSGTLLGPEGSAVGLCSSGVSLCSRSLLWGLRVLVGLLFEICIVDASIFATSNFCGCE